VLESIEGSDLVRGRDVPLVEVFTVDEQRARTSQNYVRSAVGNRLRYQGHRCWEARGARHVEVRQVDTKTGIEVVSTFSIPNSAAAVRIVHRVQNTSDSAIVITAVTTAGIGFGRSQAALAELDLVWGRSEWLAEGRWTRRPLRELVPDLSLGIHNQDARGRFAVTSHGTWSTGEFLPTGAVVDRNTGSAIAWQLETSAAWHWEVSQTLGGGVLSLLGPADKEHQFAHRLDAGAVFESVGTALAFSEGGIDGVFGELTRYRRWLRDERPADRALPVVYNDFMNTLMGDPSTEKLLPLIEAAALAGAECFCIDAGWFADPETGDWWSSVGEWREAPGRFSGGLASLIELIHGRGMRSGLWLEPEVVGVGSPVAALLPEDAFFHRLGSRVREHDRYQLDFRHPAVIRHLDETVAYLVEELGVGYLKLDYNINAGPGTEVAATSASAGLLGHTRAFRDWLVSIQTRYPDLLIENCSSGAMRMDYSLLAVTHLQSTSDQQDYRLYPPIAASAPASILPEQCGNWAYPSLNMTDDETTFALTAGIVGRLYLSGFLGELSDGQRARVTEAVTVHKGIRDEISRSIPFWPLGLPAWDDEHVVLGLRGPSRTFVAVWCRALGGSRITLPGVDGVLRPIFPSSTGTSLWRVNGDASIEISGGTSARIYEVTRA
jgi:alpha-galactosidase